MSSSKETVLAFDVYGTLLSTESIADQLSAHFGAEKAKSIAAKWRLYQLEYTWRLNSMRKSSIPNSYHSHSLSIPSRAVCPLLDSNPSFSSTRPQRSQCISASSRNRHANTVLRLALHVSRCDIVSERRWQSTKYHGLYIFQWYV